MYQSKNEQLNAEQHLPKTGYIRISELIKFIPISKSSIWRMVKEGTFPKPVKFSKGVTAWKAEPVNEWLASKEVN